MVRNSPIVDYTTNVNTVDCPQGGALKGDLDPDFLLLLSRFVRNGRAGLSNLCVLQCIGLYSLGIFLVMVYLGSLQTSVYEWDVNMCYGTCDM